MTSRGLSPYREGSIPAGRIFALLDIKWIRDNQDAFLKGLKDRGVEPD